MSMDIFLEDKYKTIVLNYFENTISFLMNQQKEFTVIAELRHITFIPELPEDILSSFDEIIRFDIINYAFESSRIEDSHLLFETGFANMSTGTTVQIPLLSIKNIAVDGYTVAINITEPIKENPMHEYRLNRSMQAMINNPKNRAFLKKK